MMTIIQCSTMRNFVSDYDFHLLVRCICFSALLSVYWVFHSNINARLIKWTTIHHSITNKITKLAMVIEKSSNNNRIYQNRNWRGLRPSYNEKKGSTTPTTSITWRRGKTNQYSNWYSKLTVRLSDDPFLNHLFFSQFNIFLETRKSLENCLFDLYILFEIVEGGGWI